MSEFELIRSDTESNARKLTIDSLTREGTLRIPFMELTLGSACFDSHPNIPGLNTVETLSQREGPEIVQNRTDWELCWKQRPLLRSLGSPKLLSAETKDLANFLSQPEESLPSTHRSQILWDWHLPEKVRVYGLGQRSSALERRGTAPVNWTTDEPTGHSRSTDPLYQAHPLLWGRTDRQWWAVLFLHTSYSRFDLAQKTSEVMTWQTLGPSLTLQVHVGENPNRVLASLKQVVQLPAVPPRWALGFHQSRWGYKTRIELEQIVEEFRRREIPLDALHLDIDHMQDYRSFTFDPVRFPQPEEMIKNWRERGVRTVCIVDPGLKYQDSVGYAPLHSGLDGGHFLSDDSGQPLKGFCWPDEAVFPDYARATCRHWWSEQAQFYLDLGVSGLWIDMNEPAIFDKPFWAGGVKQHPLPLATFSGEDGERKPLVETRNLYGSHMAQATDQAWISRRERPWVLTRSGFTGVAHHAWSWMGDNSSWWEHLAMSLPQLCSMGLVGSPFCGVDIGGFFGHCTAELFEAWIETAVLYPFMRCHSALGTRAQEPWTFGQRTEAVARKALNLRYRLLPYLYSAAIEQAQDPFAPPLLRPMFFDYPDDPRFEYLEDQVLLGPHLVACPFVKPGQNERMVTLPNGFWTDFHSGQLYFVQDAMEDEDGPIRIRKGPFVVQRDPGHLPLFIRGGGIVPTLSEELTPQTSEELHTLPLTLRIAAGPSTVSTLYLDDGESQDYQKGDFRKIVLEGPAGQIQLVSETGQPSFPLPSYRWARVSASGWIYSETRNLSELKAEAQDGFLAKFDPKI